MTRYHRLATYFALVDGRRLLTSDASRQVSSTDTSSIFREIAAAVGSDDYVSCLQYIDIHHYLPDDILTKVDRASMLVSLETRVPLLDHVLLEHAASIPSHLNLRHGTGKHVLKDAQIPYIAFKYAENSGQMQPIREQAGTFADSIKLWSGA